MWSLVHLQIHSLLTTTLFGATVSCSSQCGIIAHYSHFRHEATMAQKRVICLPLYHL